MNIEQVTEMANRVAAEHEGLEAAKEAKAKAEDELLARVVDALRPALPAMVSRIHDTSERGVLVDRELRIYLGEDGDFFRLAVGGGNLGNHLRPFGMPVHEVLLCLDLGSVIGGLVQALHSHVGSREKPTQHILAEAKRLDALVTLLAPTKR